MTVQTVADVLAGACLISGALFSVAAGVAVCGTVVLPVSGVYAPLAAPSDPSWDGLRSLVRPYVDPVTGRSEPLPALVIAPQALALRTAGTLAEEVLEDDAVLFHALDECPEGEGAADAEEECTDGVHGGEHVMVRIGRENTAVELSGVSVVASTYGRGEGEGIVAVIGPTRMDYSRVIRAVRAAQHVLRDE